MRTAQQQRGVGPLQPLALDRVALAKQRRCVVLVSARRHAVARLEELGLVTRTRGTSDKRKVFVKLTDAGHVMLEQAPEALHQRFAEKFEPLDTWEQTMLVASLQRVAAMLDASDIDAAPILQFGPAGHTDE